MRILSDAELRRLEDDHPELRARQCPTCFGKKTYIWQGQQHECDCRTQQQLQLRYFYAGIGMNYQRLTWDDVAVPEDQLAPVLDYILNAHAYVRRGIGLVLHGPVGTGKTLLANLILKELVKLDYDSYVTTYASTVTAFTAGWGSRDDATWFANRFMRSQALALDDLGKEFRRSNALHSTTFDHILRTRVQADRPTILTTNMTAQELQGGYGAAVLSLLVEKSIDVPLTGADFRPASRDRIHAEIAAGEMRPIS